MPLHETPENEITALKGYSTGDLVHIIHTYVRAHEHVPCSELGLRPPPFTLYLLLPPAAPRRGKRLPTWSPQVAPAWTTLNAEPRTIVPGKVRGKVRGSGEGCARGFFPCPDESQLLLYFFSENIAWLLCTFYARATRVGARDGREAIS